VPLIASPLSKWINNENTRQTKRAKKLSRLQATCVIIMQKRMRINANRRQTKRAKKLSRLPSYMHNHHAEK
jgi:hypothetical protein